MRIVNNKLTVSSFLGLIFTVLGASGFWTAIILGAVDVVFTVSDKYLYFFAGCIYLVVAIFGFWFYFPRWDSI